MKKESDSPYDDLRNTLKKKKKTKQTIPTLRKAGAESNGNIDITDKPHSHNPHRLSAPAKRPCSTRVLPVFTNL